MKFRKKARPEAEAETAAEEAPETEAETEAEAETEPETEPETETETGTEAEAESLEKRSDVSVERTMLIVVGCVLVNFLGRYLADLLELPLWLDSFGTVFAAYVLGPISGAIVGCTGNIIYSIWDEPTLVYGVVSLFIGVTIGAAARRKYFESVFKATSLAGGVAIGSALLSTALNLLVFTGSTGNVWGDGVRDFLQERGVARPIAVGVGQLYLDFLDKLVTVMALFLLLRLYRRLRVRRRAIKIRSVISVLLLCLICTGLLASPAAAALSGSAPETAYVQKIYGADDGIPGAHANAVVQTNDGFLWVGTNSGLYRYAGSGFRLVEDYDAVKNVNCLYVDQEGRLWIGTNDTGLVLSINGKLVNNLDTASGLPSDSVRSIVQCADGDYYVGTSDSVALVRIAIGISVTKRVEAVRGAQALAADETGHVAAVTASGGLCVLQAQELLYEIPRPASGAGFSTCAFDDSGRLYAGTADGAVHIYRLDGGSAAETGSLVCEGAGRINEISFQDGDVWILSETGVGLLDRNEYQRMDTGAFDSAVNGMAVDYQGNLWFASSKLGLLQLSETSFPNLSTKYGLPVELVNTTAVRNDILYIGSENGLSAVDLDSGAVLHNTLTKSLEGVAINCMITDPENDLWICTSGKGLLRVSPGGSTKSYGDDYRIGSTVYVCAVMPDGGVAVGGEEGLTQLRGEAAVTIPYGDALGQARILSICALSGGRLLVGTDGNGLLVVQFGSVAAHYGREEGLPSGVVRRIVPDGETGNLFLVTGNSLCYMEEDGTISQIAYFPYSDNYDLILNSGAVFVTGSAGIYVLRRDAMLSGGRYDWSLLNSRAGLKGTITENSFNALTEGKDLYLSTDRGVVRMNLDAYWTEKRSYRLMVSEIKLDGRSVPIERGSGLTISRDVKSIEFIPEIVNYSFEDPKVSYYLEGVDSGYKTVAQSELTDVAYSNLPAGEYTFHLAIIDEDTGVVREESTYSFIKEKSIHDNGWFLAYMLIVGGLFIGWLTWFVTRTSVQQTIVLQQERLALALKQVQMGNETILAIAKTVDAKDLLTSKHSQRVSDYSVLISKRVGFTEDEQENLRKAALLHDIGKIGIPDSILNKPARLTDSEYAVMKTHVTRGAEILKDFTLIEHVVEGAKYHHERYDGRGYPEGLQGRDIPLYGRIIAIADAFDAMTANRVYRQRQDFSYVMEELRKGSGTQFDPELLQVFLQVIDSGEIDVAALYAEAAEAAAESGEGKADE